MGHAFWSMGEEYLVGETNADVDKKIQWLIHERVCLLEVGNGLKQEASKGPFGEKKSPSGHLQLLYYIFRINKK